MDRMAKRAILIAACTAAGSGLAGLGLVLTQAKNQAAGSPPPGAGWWRAALLLVDCGFLAAGPWLAWRATDHRSRPARPAAARPQGWGMLLSPVLGVIVVLLAPWYGLRWTVLVALVLTVGLLLLAPAAAAGLATAGLVVLGLAVVALTAHPHADHLVLGPLLTALAAAQGTAILAFGLWLAPRTMGPPARLLRQPDAALADRVEQLTQAVNELCDLIRGGCRPGPAAPAGPAALSTPAALPTPAARGLGDAVRALARDTPARIQSDIDLPGRLDPPVESACYAAVAEALGNAVRHSGASLVQISIRHSAGRPRPPSPIRSRSGGMLRITVTDDGIGGANPARGTGLQGVERLLGTLDGILAVSSPPGGPTMIIMEVPCALSAPMTASR